jgi:hypothetical protein
MKGDLGWDISQHELAAGIVLLWLTAFAGVLFAVHWWASPSWHALATAAS